MPNLNIQVTKWVGSPNTVYVQGKFNVVIMEALADMMKMHKTKENTDLRNIKSKFHCIMQITEVS